MIIPVLADLPQVNNIFFDCISNSKVEYTNNTTSGDLIDYMVTVYPRNENVLSFDFVYGLFQYNQLAFSHNQDTIVSIASDLFVDSEPLGAFESSVLNKTLERLSKSRPTLLGRK